MPPAAFSPDRARALGGPDWLRRRRVEAAEQFAAATLPTASDEVWRYSRIDDIDLDRYTPVDPDTPTTAGVPDALEGFLASIGPRSGLVVYRDGRLAHREGSAAESFTEPGEHAFGAVAEVKDAFEELHTAFASDVACVDIPAGTHQRDPVVIVHWIDTDGAAVFPHTMVHVGEGATIDIVEVVASTDVASLVIPVVELDVAAGANVGFVNVQALGPRAWQLAHHASRVGRDASVRSATVALGGDYARVRTDTELRAEGGEHRLLAVYFGSGRQMHDFRTLQDHFGPRTTSDLLFKGAVTEAAQATYSGMIRVQKGAVKSSAFLTNRNLVLSADAGVNSVPNLEIIDENDLRNCGHAAASGPIDEEQRFYLESRGVPSSVAERLIVLGFFADVIERAPVPTLHAWLRREVTSKLDATMELA